MKSSFFSLQYYKCYQWKEVKRKATFSLTHTRARSLWCAQCVCFALHVPLTFLLLIFSACVVAEKQKKGWFEKKAKYSFSPPKKAVSSTLIRFVSCAWLNRQCYSRHEQAPFVAFFDDLFFDFFPKPFLISFTRTAFLYNRWARMLAESLHISLA